MTLETYVPQPVTVTAGGESVEVGLLRVRQIPAFARAVAPVLGALASGDLVGAAAEHFDDVVLAVSVATGKTPEWLGELDADEFLRLASAVVEVNGDFFARRLAPLMTQAATRAEVLMTPQTAGANASPSSLPVGSDGTNA